MTAVNLNEGDYVRNVDPLRNRLARVSTLDGPFNTVGIVYVGEEANPRGPWFISPAFLEPDQARGVAKALRRCAGAARLHGHAWAREMDAGADEIENLAITAERDLAYQRKLEARIEELEGQVEALVIAEEAEG